MSNWYLIKDKKSVEISSDGKFVDILFGTDMSGNNYVSVPIEFMEELSKANRAETLVSHVCGECFEIAKIRRTVLNFLSNRIFYYSRQQNANPNLPRVHARKKEIEYLLKEINNIFIETNKKLLGEPENNVMSRKSG